MHSFSSRLISWQLQHGRHGLPWQGAGGMTQRAQASGAGMPPPRRLPQSASSASNVSEADAYRVWLSEIMLQQTQVATVLPYYQRFIAAFPTIAALAAASQEQVLAHWSGLGYYARGRNLHRAAQLIAEKYRGEFPRQYEQILELPGIGRSTAAAICALAFHEHRAILDGNVKRVLARHRGIEGSPSSKAVEAQLWQQAETLLPPPPRGGRAGERVNGDSAIATYTQALMDLGATVCTRSKPKCGACPVQADCVAYQTNRTHELPTPRPHKAVPEKHTTFLLLLHGNDILLEKRAPSGIWGGLWCPPQLEDERVADYLQRSGVAVSKTIELAEFTHTFTHFKLHITPLLLRVAHKPLQAQQPGSVWLGIEEALQAAIPTPARRVLGELLKSHS